MLTNTWEHDRTKVKFTFYDQGTEKDFEPYTQSYAVCFTENGKIIIGFSPNGYNDWLLSGGTREKGEDGITTLIRELDEELSLEVKSFHLIGAQRVDYLNVKKKSHYQLRYAAIVKMKKLTPDPDSGLLWKRTVIDPKDFSKYIKWGNIGEHLLEESLNWFKEEKAFEKKVKGYSYRKGTQAYIVNDKDELLLVRNVSDEKFWKVPSGGMEQGETPEETVKREMKEELGVEIDILKRMPFKNKFDWPLDVIKILEKKYHRQGYKGQDQFVFIVKIKRDQKIRADPKEVKAYKWVKFGNIGKFFRFPDQKESAKKVLDEYKKIKR